MTKHKPDTTGSTIAVRARLVDVDHIFGSDSPAGVHSKVFSSSGLRSVEIEATQSPITLRLTPRQNQMLALEYTGMQPREDKRGRQLRVGLRGAALYIWIAAQMKRDYPDITFMAVRDELSRPFMNVARDIWTAQRLSDEAYNRKSG